IDASGGVHVRAAVVDRDPDETDALGDRGLLVSPVGGQADAVGCMDAALREGELRGGRGGGQRGRYGCGGAGHGCEHGFYLHRESRRPPMAAANQRSLRASMEDVPVPDLARTMGPLPSGLTRPLACSPGPAGISECRGGIAWQRGLALPYTAWP